MLTIMNRLGWYPGKDERWCSSCNRLFNGGPKAFKCHGCAKKQAGEVDEACRDVGMEDGDD